MHEQVKCFYGHLKNILPISWIIKLHTSCPSMQRTHTWPICPVHYPHFPAAVNLALGNVGIESTAAHLLSSGDTNKAMNPGSVAHYSITVLLISLLAIVKADKAIRGFCLWGQTVWVSLFLKVEMWHLTHLIWNKLRALWDVKLFCSGRVMDLRWWHSKQLTAGILVS